MGTWPHIFQDNHQGQGDSTVFLPQYRDANVTTMSNTVAAEGLVATVTFDTTGFSTPGQSWDLVLDGVIGGNARTDFGLVETDVRNGKIRIIPEPATATMLGGLGLLLLLLWRRRFVRRSPRSS